MEDDIPSYSVNFTGVECRLFDILSFHNLTMSMKILKSSLFIFLLWTLCISCRNRAQERIESYRFRQELQDQYPPVFAAASGSRIFGGAYRPSLYGGVGLD